MPIAYNRGMSFSPKPCTHCGGTQFHVLPEVAIEAHKAVAVFGMTGTQHVGHWRVTLVVCVQCSRTETFTTNAAELVQQVPGAYPASSIATPPYR